MVVMVVGVVRTIVIETAIVIVLIAATITVTTTVLVPPTQDLIENIVQK